MIEMLGGQWATIGGPVMALLLMVSVAATAAAIVKLRDLARLGVGRRDAADEAIRRWRNGDADGAQQVATSETSALCAVIAEACAAVRRWPKDKERAREVATSRALGLIEAMNRHMRILETSVQAAPMLGLLGTVLGMIAAFNEMSVGSGAIDPTQLAGGIWVALSTTALGLMIAIPFYFFTSWIEGRIEREKAAIDAALLAVVYGPGAEGSIEVEAPSTAIGEPLARSPVIQ